MKDIKVIAIFGKSCVGKSEVAAKLAITLSLPVRHCGERVKERARQLGISPTALSKAEHKSIDDETRSLAFTCDREIIIEGSFLDLVLPEASSILFVQLTCDDDERRNRHMSRSLDATVALEGRDESDNKLRDEISLAIRTPRFRS